MDFVNELLLPADRLPFIGDLRLGLSEHIGHNIATAGSGLKCLQVKLCPLLVCSAVAVSVVEGEHRPVLGITKDFL